MKENKKNIKTDLKALDAIKDEDIDYSDIPELDDNFFKHAKLIEPKSKVSLTVRYDKDVIDFFKHSVGKGYQTKMNAVLKTYVNSKLAHRNHHH